MANAAKPQSYPSDLGCAQSTEGDGDVQPCVSARGARHEHASVGAGFAEGLFGRVRVTIFFVLPDDKQKAGVETSHLSLHLAYFVVQRKSIVGIV